MCHGCNILLKGTIRLFLAWVELYAHSSIPLTRGPGQPANSIVGASTGVFHGPQVYSVRIFRRSKCTLRYAFLWLCGGHFESDTSILAQCIGPANVSPAIAGSQTPASAKTAGHRLWKWVSFGLPITWWCFTHHHILKAPFRIGPRILSSSGPTKLKYIITGQLGELRFHAHVTYCLEMMPGLS